MRQNIWSLPVKMLNCGDQLQRLPMIDTLMNSNISQLEIMLGCGMTEMSSIMKHLKILPIPQCLRVVDVEHCPMGTRFLLCRDNLLRPNQKWTVGNKTKISDIQVSQAQEEEPINDVTRARMTIVSPGMYGHHQFTPMEQQPMAYLQNQNRSQIFTCLPTQSSSGPIRTQAPIPKRGPYTVQYNGFPLIPIRVE